MHCPNLSFLNADDSGLGTRCWSENREPPSLGVVSRQCRTARATALPPDLRRPSKPVLFNPLRADLYSKAWSAAFLREFLGDLEDITEEIAPGASRDDWLCPEDAVGSVVRTVEEVQQCRDRLRNKGYPRIVIKEPFGLAGRNVLRLSDTEPTEAQGELASPRALTLGRGVVIEPWLDRVVDFSVQMELGPRVSVSLGLRASSTMMPADSAPTGPDQSTIESHRRRYSAPFRNPAS